MKITLALLSAAVAVNAASHMHYGHKHLHAQHKREYAATVVDESGPTVTVFVLDGHSISEADVDRGLKNGTYKLAPEANTTSSASTYSAPKTSSAPKPSSTQHPGPSAGSPPWAHGHGGPPNDAHKPTGWGGPGAGVNSPFPDGQLSCSQFPAQFGAIPVAWQGLGGWTGVQQPQSNEGGFANILTVTKNMLFGSAGGCAEGAYCSYACPAGYQKSQWPTTQGATGQSVGGLLCQGGKLHLTNPDLSKNLCIPGAQEVTVLVQNKCSRNVPICRTDYPGTESETVPLDTQPGQTTNLTCPDASNYYTWQGASTSAQYYVNPMGSPVSDACTWNSAGSNMGNFAPMNIGAGFKDGAAWLSIFQNSPTTDTKLDFAVEIVGDGMSGTCKYSNGQYCGGANYDQCSETAGCTVSMSSGTATFILCPDS